MYGAVDCITVSSSTVHGLLYSGKLSREKNVYEFAVSEPSMKASGKMKFWHTSPTYSIDLAFRERFLLHTRIENYCKKNSIDNLSPPLFSLSLCFSFLLSLLIHLPIHTL